jgi:tRNA A-37 threonylcarbamoyl transferase component Bud32
LKELPSKPIAEGRTAEIFLWDDHHILKLYREWCPPHWIKDEARIAQAVYDAGIPSPAAGEILDLNGRQGLIYERIQGISMLQDMNARPWLLLKHARSLTELHVQIHQKSIDGLPKYKDRLRYDTRNTQHLGQDLGNKALAQLDALPDSQTLCHGDFHPGNIILTPAGPIVIDWMTASAGSPWADVARTSLLLSIGPKSAGKLVSPIIKIAIRLYYRAYLNRYHTLVPDTKNELKRWIPVIAAARLNEGIVPEREALIEMVKEGLNP